MASSQIHFYDSATPQNVPSGVYAAVYVNGFAWPQSQIKRMERVIRISVQREAFWAKYARVLDIENGAALPQDFIPFAHARLAHGFNDPTAYVNRSNWDTVKQLVADAGLEKFVHYWVATLDETQDIPGAWAVQYQGGQNAPYDVSILHGLNTFHRP